MTKVESTIIEFIRKNIIGIGFIAVTVMAFLLRISLFKFESGDYIYYLNPWVEQLKTYDGLSGIGQNIGEYNVPYMLFLAIVPYFHVKYLYVIKMFSVVFDFIGAFGVLKVISDIRATKLFTAWNLAAYSAVMFSPVVFLNSAFWAQCDFMLAAMIIFCIYFMQKEKFAWAMVFFGIAISIKLQAVFFLPAIFTYYFASKKMKAVNFLFAPLVYFIGIFPALIAGRGLKDSLTIYFQQTKLYTQLTMSCPNLYYFITGDFETFKKVGIVLTLTLLGLGICAFIYTRKKAVSKLDLVLLALWCTQVCIFFLPSMHERYTFTTCILAIVWSFIYKKDWWMCILINAISLLSYTPFLFQNTAIDMRFVAAANFIVLLILTRRLFITLPEQQNQMESKTVTA